MLWALPLAGMALGALRGNAQAKRQQAIEDDSRKQLAAQQRYSPWTGRSNFSQIQYAGATPFDATLGGGLQGGIAGASLSQGIEGAATQTAGQSAWAKMQEDEKRRMAEQMQMANQRPVIG